MHSHRLRHNRILQGKLANIRQQHTIFTGYKSKPRTRTDPSSTAKFAYLTRRNFGLDLRPSGHFVQAVVGTDSVGKPKCEARELDEGDVIAHGTTDVEGYGRTPVERAQFIVDTIRVHLAREVCKLQAEDLPSIEALLGREVRWCPACGIRLSSD